MKTEFEALDVEGAAMENALDDLTVAIRNVELALRTRLFKARTKTPIPQIEAETERHYLVWAMHDKTGWALHVLTRLEAGDDKTALLVTAPWRLRLRATECFDALLVQAALELRTRNKEVRDAITRCETFTKKITEPKP